VAVKKIIGTILLAAVAYGAKTALRMEQASYNTDESAKTEQSKSEKSFSLPSLSFLSQSKAVKSMQLTSFDKVIFKGCLTDHKIQQVKDYPQVSAKDLCACTAKQATAKIPSEHLSEYMRIHAVSLNDSMLSVRAQTPLQQDEVKENWNIVIDNMIKNSELSKDDFTTTLSLASEINSLCRSPKVYTPESLAKIAQLQPLHMQSQAIALKLRPAMSEQQALNNK